MKPRFLFSLLPVLWCACLHAQSLADFAPPAGANTPSEAEALRKITAPDKVQTTPNEKLGQPVVSAATVQDAANAACVQLVEVPGGARFIATGSGIGAVASGTAYYASDVQNPNLVLIAQRRAFIAAHLKAKSELAKMLRGLSVEAKQFIGEEIQSIDDAEGNRTNIKEESLETGKEAIKAMLRGVIVYDMYDDSEKGEVRVSVITTPRTQGASQTVFGNMVDAHSIEQGLEYVFQQIKLAVIPPDGGNVIVSRDGRVAWVAYGSQLRRRNVDKRVEAKLSEAARDQSVRRARSALLGVINGEGIQSESVDLEEFKAETKQFDAVIDEQGNETIKTKEKQEFEARARLAVKETFGSEKAGELPPGITTRTYESKDGNWFYSVAVFYAPATEAAKGLAKSMDENSPLRQAPAKSYELKPDGSFKKDKDGRLIPLSLGKGRVANDKDL